MIGVAAIPADGAIERWREDLRTSVAGALLPLEACHAVTGVAARWSRRRWRRWRPRLYRLKDGVVQTPADGGVCLHSALRIGQVHFGLERILCNEAGLWVEAELGKTSLREGEGRNHHARPD